jgi:GNAT superfamily N-acetyltransferase
MDVDRFLEVFGQLSEENNAKAIIDSGGKGFILAVKYPDLIKGGSWAWCLMWFVKKEFRCQGVGSRLLDEFIRWGKGAGCKHLRIDHLLTRDKHAIMKKFTEKGFKPLEVHYYMEVK